MSARRKMCRIRASFPTLEWLMIVLYHEELWTYSQKKFVRMVVNRGGLLVLTLHQGKRSTCPNELQQDAFFGKNPEASKREKSEPIH